MKLSVGKLLRTVKSIAIWLPYTEVFVSTQKKASELLVEQLLQDAIFTYIKELKKQKGLTATQIAELANVSISSLEKYLSGCSGKNPGFAFICAVVRALGGSVDEAIGLVPSKANAAASMPNELIIQVHEKEKEAWERLIVSQREQITSQKEQISQQTVHMKKLFGIVMGSISIAFLAVAVLVGNLIA